MAEETYIMTKESIKEAVSESLLEALQVADDKRQAKKDERGLTYVLDIFGKTIPIIIVALISWMCVTIVEVQKEIALTQKDIAAARSEIGQVKEHLISHDVNSELNRQKSSLLHHTAIVNPCTSCHTLTGLKAGVKVPKK